MVVLDCLMNNPLESIAPIKSKDQQPALLDMDSINDPDRFKHRQTNSERFKELTSPDSIISPRTRRGDSVLGRIKRGAAKLTKRDSAKQIPKVSRSMPKHGMYNSTNW